MENNTKRKIRIREVKKYATLDEALKSKNDLAREYLKNVKWPENMV